MENKKHLCNCGKMAVWDYMPGFSSGSNSYFCDDCVTSVDEEPCECEIKPFSWQKPEGVEGVNWKRYGKNQWYYIDEKGRPYPCCEYDYDENGFDIYEEE